MGEVILRCLTRQARISLIDMPRRFTKDGPRLPWASHNYGFAPAPEYSISRIAVPGSTEDRVVQ